MATRRSFIPEKPACLGLETRLAPSGGGWLNQTLKDLGNRLTPHHHNTNAAAGIEQMWKDSAKAEHAAQVAQAAHARHHAKVK
jgi:hypothetical protein